MEEIKRNKESPENWSVEENFHRTKIVLSMIEKTLSNKIPVKCNYCFYCIRQYQNKAGSK